MKYKKFILFAFVMILILLSLSNITKGESLLEDGTYLEETKYDDLGCKSVLKMKIVDNEIMEVDYNEVSLGGFYKSEDIEYSKAMKNTVGVSPKEAYKYLENQLLKTQNIHSVDIITGATESSEKFRKLVNNIIK